MMLGMMNPVPGVMPRIDIEIARWGGKDPELPTI